MNDVISRSVSLYHNIWGSYFENSTWLDMYIIFSMKKFKKEVKNVNETNFWAQQEKISSITSIMMLCLRLNILRQKVKLLHQLPMVIKKILYMNWKHIKGVFRNNFGNNPKTGQDWTSQDVIIDLLMKEDLLWLQQDSLLHYIMSPS